MRALLALLIGCTQGPDKDPPARHDDTAPPDSGVDSAVDSAPDSGDTSESAPPVDADADGWAAEEDCDDSDPTRYPGASDPCDGVDQDCDGVAAGAGACSDIFVVDETSAAGWWIGDSAGAGLSLHQDTYGSWGVPTDLDGDGIADVVANNRGAMFLHARIPWPDTRVTDGDWLGNWITDSTMDLLGDFDGDGAIDFSMTTTEEGLQELYEGAVYLVRGPPDRWPAYRTSPVDQHDAMWTHNLPIEWFGKQTAGAELTGDGLADLVILSGRPLVDESGPQGYLRLLRGRSTGLPSEAPIEDEEPWYTVDVPVGWSWQLAILPDLDGDGLDELAFQVLDYDDAGDRADHLAIFPPDVRTPTYTGLELTELWTPIANGGAFRELAVQPDARSVGDLDGDGYEDGLLAVYDSADGEEIACSAVLHGAVDLPSRTVSEQLGGTICGSDDVFTPADRTVPDVDGDGTADLYFSVVVNNEDDLTAGYHSCVVPAAFVPATGTVPFDEVRRFCFGTGDDDAFRGGTDMADLDGDGLLEILAADATWNRETGRIFVVPGFAIPWDDPTRW